MKIKQLIEKYGYIKRYGFVDLTKYPEKNITLKVFNFIKEAQELLSDEDGQKEFNIQGKRFRKGLAADMLYNGYLYLQENYTSCIIRNNLHI